MGLFVSLFLARKLGPELYGDLSYAQASAGLLGFMSLLAIEAIVMRMLVDEPTRHPEILGSALALRMLGGGTMVLTATISMLVFGVQSSMALAIPLIAGTALFQSVDVVDYWFRIKLLSRYAVTARVCALLIGAALRVWAAGAPSPLVALAMVILVESTLVAAGLLFVFVRVDRAEKRFQASAVRSREILRQSAPMLLSAVAIAIYVRFGFIVLEKVSGSFHVGQLGAATMVAETLHALPVAIAASYGPILLAKRRVDPIAFERDLVRLLRLFSAGGIAMATVVCLYAQWFVPAVLGVDYAESGKVLSVLVWSIVFVYLSVASEFWFIGHSYQRYFLPKTLVSAGVFILLTLLLIPRFGALGAAVATVVTYSVSAFWSNLLFRTTRPLFYWQARALLLLRVPVARANAPSQEGIPIMQDAYRKYDSSLANNYDRDREGEDHWLKENEFIAASFNDRSFNRLLDAPVGTGRFIPYYRGVHEIFGLDASAEMLAMARERVEHLGLTNVKIDQGDIFSLPFADSFFDVTICWRFVHLIPQHLLADAIKELGRVTHGELFLQAYVYGRPLSRLTQAFLRWRDRLLRLVQGRDRNEQPWSHIRAYFHRARDLETVFAQSGLRVVRQQSLCQYQGHDVRVYVLARK